MSPGSGESGWPAALSTGSTSRWSGAGIDTLPGSSTFTIRAAQMHVPQIGEQQPSWPSSHTSVQPSSSASASPIAANAPEDVPTISHNSAQATT